MSAPHPVCALMRQLRQAAGLSLAGFERKHGILAVTAGSYERGDRRPTVDQAEAIVNLYGLTLAAVPINGSAADHHTRTPEDMALTLEAIAHQIRHNGELQ